MVETIMIFALGFVAAALMALLIIPAINARAERLARRRAEALFPMSVSELTAEKDHLRAEFAVLQRRIERKAEEAQAIKHQTMEELGRRAVRIEALEGTLAQRDQTIASLEATLADTQDRLNATDKELEETKLVLSGTRETLTALENAHRATLDELSNTRMELDISQGNLTRTKADLLQAEEKLAKIEADHADACDRLGTALNDLDTKRITISDLETRLMTQTGRGDEFERALADRDKELAEERQRLTGLAQDLAAEQERNLSLEQRLREAEGDRDEAHERIASLETFDDRNEDLRRQITAVAAQVMAAGNDPAAGATAKRGKQRKPAAQ